MNFSNWITVIALLIGLQATAVPAATTTVFHRE
jgi:hypothetical protein